MKCGRSTSADGLRAFSPNRSLPLASAKKLGPNPIVRVNLAGGRPTASPVSSGGASPGPFTAPYWPMSRPAVIRAAAAVHSFSNEITASRLVAVTSNVAKCSRS